MKEKTPQEKKAHSYAKDRRNSYGANDKASRNSIPKRKAEANRVYRRTVDSVLKQVETGNATETAEDISDEVKNIGRSDWKKYPDVPLGEVVKRSLENRIAHTGKGKTARKSTKDFIENLEIEVEQVEVEKWMAKAVKYPEIFASATERNRAIEKLKHIATVAKRNKLGANISVQIDGKFITPILTK